MPNDATKLVTGILAVHEAFLFTQNARRERFGSRGQVPLATISCCIMRQMLLIAALKYQERCQENIATFWTGLLQVLHSYFLASGGSFGIDHVSVFVSAS